MRTTERNTAQKVSILTLVGIVVGSMVGGGVFTLPRNFGSATGVLGAIIAWIIAGTGMLMLAFVFQSLALRRPLFDQVKDTMLVTTFVFLGVEGASVYSRFARRRADVGRATLLGFLSVLAIFASVTMVSYGVLPREDLANTHPPSMAAVLESVVGSWGATFISIGVIISVQGAYLAWTLINAEVLYMPATTAVMPKFLARNNKNHTPIAALITTNIAVQAMLLSVLLVRDALDFMLALDTALSLIPYLFAAGYALKLTITGETYAAADESERRRQLIIAAAAVLYSIFLLYAAGLKYLLVASIVYAPGTLLYIWARREQGMRVFQPAEA